MHANMFRSAVGLYKLLQSFSVLKLMPTQEFVFLNTCQSKSYPKALYLIALISAHTFTTTYKRVLQLCVLFDPDLKDL